MSSSYKQDGISSYEVDLSSESLIISDSLRGSLSEKFLRDTKMSEMTKAKVHMTSSDSEYVGELVSFELHSDHTVIDFDMRTHEALQLMRGARFDLVSVRHSEEDLWSEQNIPKRKDSVTVTLLPEGAHVTLVVRKITPPERHK